MKKKEENFLDKVPSIKEDITWEMSDGHVVVIKENKGFYDKLAQKLFFSPEKSRISLEEKGSYIWQLIDGKKTVYEIGKKLDEKFGEDASPLYERLCEYIQSLSSIGFINLK